MIPKVLTLCRSTVHLEWLLLPSGLAGVPQGSGEHKPRSQGTGEGGAWASSSQPPGLLSAARGGAVLRAEWPSGEAPPRHSPQGLTPARPQEPCISIQSLCGRMCCSSPLTTSSVSSFSSTMSYESM